MGRQARPWWPLPIQNHTRYHSNATNGILSRYPCVIREPAAHVTRRGETVNRQKFHLTLILAITLAFAGCASAPTTTAAIAPGGPALAVKASNFAFDPNTITVHGTGTITLTITNTGGTAHNIIIDDPDGKVIDSAEIPPNATISTQVTFPAPGNYYFFCNHPFHAGFGMKGHFIVLGS